MKEKALHGTVDSKVPADIHDLNDALCFHLLTFCSTSRAVSTASCRLVSTASVYEGRMKGDASLLMGTDAAPWRMTPSFFRSSILKLALMCWYSAGKIWISAVRKGWLGMKESFSVGPLGGLVLSVPVRYHVFHADHHSAESSRADSSPGGGACRSAPLYRVKRSNSESERTRGLPGPAAERGSMRTGGTPIAASASPALSESFAGVTIWRIS